jgi:hypothetical protein
MDLAIPVALLRGLRWWILPCLPRDADERARDSNNRAWDRLIAERGVITARRHATPTEATTLAAQDADFIHEVKPGGAFCVTPRPAPGQPVPPVCICGVFALTWQEGWPVVPNLTQLALDLATPLTQAVLRKMAPRFKREARKGPHAPATANAPATLDVIVQALLWTYVLLLKDRAEYPRDPLAARVARLCATRIALPDKRGHRSRTLGEEFEWWLAVLHDLVRRVMRADFPKEQWATTGRTRDKHARLEKLRKTWPTLPETVLKEVKEEDNRAEAERRLTAAVAETVAGITAAPEAVRRALLRHRDQIRRVAAADHASDPE